MVDDILVDCVLLVTQLFEHLTGGLSEVCHYQVAAFVVA